MKTWINKNYPFLIVIAAPIILFIGPILSGRVIFWGTPVMQFIPWQATAFEQLKHGIFPLWNPLNGMGAPLFANYQVALLYPPNWFMFLFYLVGGTPALAFGQTLSIVFHLAWAGVGMVLLTRRLGLGKLAQTISGLSFALCGFLVPRVSFFPMIWSISWMPWIIYAASFIVNPRGSKTSIGLKDKLGKILLVILFLTLQLLAGHAQMTWYILVFTAIWVLVNGIVSQKLEPGLAAMGIFMLCVLVAALVASVQLLPTLEYLLESQRAGAVNYQTAVTYSFWPWRFLTLLAPNMFGSPAAGNYWGYGNYWEDALYIGVLPLILGLITLGSIFRRKNQQVNPLRPLIIFCWITIVVAISLALGKNFYLFPFLFKYVPTFSLFQSPTRFMILAEFSLCLLAGIGIDQLKVITNRRLYWTRLATMGAFAVALASILAVVFLPAVKSTLIRGFASFGVFALGSGLLLLFQPKNGEKTGIWSWILVGFVAVDLLFANWNFTPTISASFFNTPDQNIGTAYETSRIFIPGQDEYDIKYKWFFRFDTFNPGLDWTKLYAVDLADINLLSANAVVNNYDPFMPSRYATLINYLGALDQQALVPWMELMNSNQIESIDKAKTYSPETYQISDTKQFRFMTCAKYVNNDLDAWNLTRGMLREGSQFKTTIILESKERIVNSSCGDQPQADITLIQGLPRKTVMNINSNQAGYLFIANTWYPGWHASVDGKSTPILHADFNFQAIPIPEGNHQVQITYSPASFTAGAFISGMTIIFILGIVVLLKIKKNNINI